MFAPLAAIILASHRLGEEVTVALHIFDVPPEGCASDWTMPQNWDAFTEVEHAVWDELLARQSAALDKLASKAFLGGLDILDFAQPGIPDHGALNARLKNTTGWEVVAVPGWIPNQPFFEHLANKRFPAANFLRSGQNMDYSEEPDMFHDIFGHVPLLTDPVFSDFLVAYGKAGLRAEKLGAADYLGRLWLYTVEFGLVVEDGALRAFGGGLLSSLAETVAAVTDPEVRRLSLDIERVMRTGYHFDRFQEVYFVVDSFADLLRQTEEANFAVIYDRISTLPQLAPGDRTDEDRPFALAHGSNASPGPLSAQQIEDCLPGLGGWNLTAGGDAIERQFVFADFREASGFIARAACAAEQMGHHPSWTNLSARVDVRLTTPEAAGPTMRDIELAHAIDRAAGSV